MKNNILSSTGIPTKSGGGANQFRNPMSDNQRHSGAQSFHAPPHIKDHSTSLDEDLDMGDTDECVFPNLNNAPGSTSNNMTSGISSNLNSGSKSQVQQHYRSSTPHQYLPPTGQNNGSIRNSNLENVRSPLLSNRKDQTMPPSDNKQNNQIFNKYQEQPAPYQMQYLSNQSRPQAKNSAKSSILLPSGQMNHNIYEERQLDHLQYEDVNYEEVEDQDYYQQQQHDNMIPNSNQQTHKKKPQQQQKSSQQQTAMKPSKSHQNLNVAALPNSYQYQTAPTQQSDDPENEQDFNKAYLKLVKKVYDEQGNNILITNEELEKAQYTQQFLSVENFNKRNQQCLENKQQKNRLLAEMKQQAEMQECTFKPQTYSQKQKRNFDQFLKDQAQFEEQKKKKIQERYEINMHIQEQELKLQPQVNKKSARMIEMKKKVNKDEMTRTLDSNQPVQTNNSNGIENLQKPVYERLHQLNQEKIQKQMQRVMEQTANTRNMSKTHLKKNKSEANFQNMTRSNEMLYQDAKRRQDKQLKQKKDLMKLQEEQINSTRPPTGVNNSKFAAQKFEKEFYFMTHQVLNELGHKNGEEESQDFNLRDYDEKRINYVKLGQLVTELGYIPANIAPDSVERELLFDMWNLLQGEENNGIFIINLKKFLLSIQGICLDSIEQNSSNYLNSKLDKNNSGANLQLSNFDQYGIIRISPQESRQIFIRFKPLYVNRVYYQGQFKRIKYVDNSCTFRPQISKVTEQLAQQKRMRLLSENRYTDGEEGGEDQQNTQQQIDPNRVDLVQILLHPVNFDQQQWRQQAKQILEAKEMEECTFKPKITHYDGNTVKSRGGLITTDKCMELYMKAKNMREKRDKTRDDFEYEKGVEECTFQPNIDESQKTLDQLYFSSNKISDSNFFGPNNDDLTLDPTSTIKGYQMVMNRMKKGREDREKVKAMQQRGIPGTVIDESQLQPFNMATNPNYKGAFSTYSHNPDNIVKNQNTANNQTTHSYSSNNQKMQNSKSNESLGKPKSAAQNFNKTQILNQANTVSSANITKQSNVSYTSSNTNGVQNLVNQYKYEVSHNKQNSINQQEKENINNSNGSLSGGPIASYQNNSNSAGTTGSAGSSGIFGGEKQLKYENRSNTATGHQTTKPVLQTNQAVIANGRHSRFSDQPPQDQLNSDLSYDDDKKLFKGNGFQSMPSDTDPDHSIVSKLTSAPKQPLLYVDVNLGPGKSERIVVYDGDTAESLADKFALNHGLDMNMRGKLAALLDSQIAGLLEKIEEEQNSMHSDNI